MRVGQPPDGTLDYDAVVVGAGIGGLYALHRLRGVGLSVRVFEAGDGVGGTWYWNRYPGCRCDVESFYYSYSFSEALQQEWRWTERYPMQPEILTYIDEVCKRFDLRRDIQLRTRVTAASYDDISGTWMVETDRGDRVRCQFLVTAAGCLSDWQIPDFPGLESYGGVTYHTGNWPREDVDFRGKRVGVIGTGSSGVQVIPEIAQQAEHLFVFQRTPSFSVPANQRPLTLDEDREMKAKYPQIRVQQRESAFGIPFAWPPESALEVTERERTQRFEEGWAVGGPAGVGGAYKDLQTNDEANTLLVEFFHSKIRGIVLDPGIADLLCPKTYPVGAKRMCVDKDYYATYNRPNVTLVDIARAPIKEITHAGLVTGGREYELDAIVFATGYDAVTGPLMKMDIRGRGGLLLRDAWKSGPRSHLGIQVAGFPNLFTITGPGSPSVLSNMMVSIEQHVDWVAEAIAYLGEHGFETIEPTVQAQDAWVDLVAEIASHTLIPRADSWYRGANIPGKPRVVLPYLGGVGTYRQKCDEVAAAGYEGFALGQPAVTATA